MDNGWDTHPLRGDGKNTSGMAQLRASDPANPTRSIVYAGLIAAAYAVTTLALAPLSFGPLQFRLAGLLKPLALVHPVYALGLAIGVAIGNLASPFGAWDYFAMPVVTYAAARACYSLRRCPLVGLLVQAGMIATGVAFLPLHLGGRLPVWPTIALVFASETVLYVTGYVLLRRSPLWK